MGRQKPGAILRDILACASMRIRLIFQDRLSCVLLLATAFVFAAVFGGLNLAAADNSVIHIGVVDEDDSKTSRRLLSSLCETEQLSVHTGTRRELEQELYDGYISGLFIISRGYGEKIDRGSTERLVTVVGAEDDKVSVLLADIFAGAMLYDICAAKGTLEYQGVSLHDNAAAGDIYGKKLAELADDEALRYTFDVSFIEGSGGDAGTVSSSIIYRQLIGAMMAMLFSLVAFILCVTICSERERGICGRRRLAAIRTAWVRTGDFCALYAVMASVCVVSCAAIVLTGDYADGEKTKVFFNLLLTALIYSFIMNLIFYCASLVPWSVNANTAFGSAVIITFGVCGFLYVFRGIVGADISAFEYIPNCIYIGEMAKIL